MLARKIVHVAFAGLAASAYLACAAPTDNPPAADVGGAGVGGAGIGGSGIGGAGVGGAGVGGAGVGGAGTGGATGGSGGTAGSGGAGGMAGSGVSGAGAGGAASGNGGMAAAGAGSGGAAGSGVAGTGAAGNAGGGSTEPCTGPGMLETGDSEHSLTVGDFTYPVNIHVPDSYDGVARMPVVFDFHGLGGNEDQMQRLSGWAATGDREGFITVFPGGPDNGWNAGGCCTDTPTDVEFVREFIAYLDTEGCIDTKRVYASGCSNGGAMSYRLACEAADVIAAVAPVDFDCVVGGRCGSCTPARPITEIQFRGTNDSAVPYSGAEPNFTTWGEINMCSGSPEALPENSS